jgi:WD repeat and SOF domain-containing protein 1
MFKTFVLFFLSVPRNRDPAQHPFQKEREYTRALNAVKLERTFAKPFLGALDGHRDGVKTLMKHPVSLALMLSGSSDGEVSLLLLKKKQQQQQH